jgi:hypothetical protein
MTSSHLLTKMTAQIESQMPKMPTAKRMISPRLRSIELFIRAKNITDGAQTQWQYATLKNHRRFSGLRQRCSGDSLSSNVEAGQKVFRL